MTLPDALYSALFPFLIGLLVGFAAGLIAGIKTTIRRLNRRRHQQGKRMPTYTDATNPTPGRRPWLGNEHLSRFGWLLAAMGTLAIIASIISLVNDRNISSCLAGYAQTSATSTKARVEAGDIDRDADNRRWIATQDSIDALASILDMQPQTDPAARRRITDEYKVRFERNRDTLGDAAQQKVRAEEIRDAHPLPAPPAC